MKKLKFWNGRGHGKYVRGHMNIAAYSQKHAAELLSKVIGGTIGIYEIKEYYSNCWGNSMKDITPTAPGVWVEEEPHTTTGKVTQII